jgi:hypothetical protein
MDKSILLSAMGALLRYLIGIYDEVLYPQQEIDQCLQNIFILISYLFLPCINSEVVSSTKHSDGENEDDSYSVLKNLAPTIGRNLCKLPQRFYANK